MAMFDSIFLQYFEYARLGAGSLRAAIHELSIKVLRIELCFRGVIPPLFSRSPLE